MTDTTARDKGTAVVTGGAQGIGRSTTARLMADGYDVLALDVNGDQLVEVQLNPPQPGVRLPQVPTPTSAPHP